MKAFVFFSKRYMWLGQQDWARYLGNGYIVCRPMGSVVVACTKLAIGKEVDQLQLLSDDSKMGAQLGFKGNPLRAEQRKKKVQRF
jgi:hypothetical protein